MAVRAQHILGEEAADSRALASQKALLCHGLKTLILVTRLDLRL